LHITNFTADSLEEPENDITPEGQEKHKKITSGLASSGD